MGTLVTFYSYKGGVGRTMALANIAVLLAMWGKKTLVVDWDLEAPGVEHFLLKGNERVAAQKRKGLIDLLTALSESASADVSKNSWEPLLVEKQFESAKTPLFILTSGARTHGYFRNVRKLDVKSFYEEQNGGHIIEGLRNAWKANFDFVLVDSRTGITDIGGICTIQLPDILALVFTATEQSLMGAVDVAKKAATERQKLPFDRSLVPTVPIPSRFDTQTEHEIAKDWLEIFEKALEPLYAQWLPKEVNRRKFLELTKIPYTPYFSFGEKLPVVEQGTSDPAGLGYAYETVAALIGNNLQHADLNRDEFVQLARTPDHFPNIPLRDLASRAVLFIDLVASTKLMGEGKDGIFKRFHSIVTACALKEGGQVALSSGDSMMIAFPLVQKAVQCASCITEALAVRTPIIGTFGHLRARMAVHASPELGDQRPSMNSLLAIVARIASKAQEGGILISDAARELVEGRLENVRFNSKGEQLELSETGGLPKLEDLYEVVGITPITLNPQERNFLFEQDPKSKGGGGFQAFLVGLQNKVDKETGRVELTISDREKIARYAHDYKGGGWQGRLRKIFGRSLGKDLGREIS